MCAAPLHERDFKQSHTCARDRSTDPLNIRDIRIPADDPRSCDGNADAASAPLASDDPAEHVELTFRALPSSIPASIRVRRLLKIALRSLDLRCTKARPVPSVKGADDAK